MKKNNMKILETEIGDLNDEILHNTFTNIFEELSSDAPIKSDMDKKEYRVLKLANGLQAVLVSTEKYEHTKSKMTNMNENNDNNEVDMAACGLCVNVGSFSDPFEIQGLAHLLEHVILMGSEKYPEENAFDKFIKDNGGFWQANTGYEKTTYIFQVPTDCLLSAMDRFANFFINPLFKKDVILRERQSVDNEFHIDISSDYERSKQLFHILPSKNHPASKFSCGNLITLCDNIEEKKLISELHAFKKIYYSAHRMTLAIQVANLHLDILEDYTKKYFSDISSNFLSTNLFMEFSGFLSFEAQKFQKLYKIKSIKNMCELELKWIMQPSMHFYKIKPINYISWIVNQEGKGSLSHYLRKKKLCDRVSSTYEEYLIYTVFTLNLVLPRNETMYVKEILDSVFSFFNMLRKNGSEKRIFDEIKQIAETRFRFAEEISPAANVQNLCHAMQLYPPCNYITGNKLFFEYNNAIIQSFLDQFNTNNVFIVLSDSTFENKEFDCTEPWYRIKYSSCNIPKEWIEIWKVINSYQDFYLPSSNIFVTLHFPIAQFPDNVLNYPIKIDHDDYIEIWYKPDLKFHLPHSYVYLHLINPVCVQTCNECVMQRLFVVLLQELALEELYAAKSAGLFYNITESHKGFFVKVNGFNDKLPLLLKKIINLIAKSTEIIQEHLFNLVKTQLLKYYSTACYDPGVSSRYFHIFCILGALIISVIDFIIYFSEIISSLLEVNFWTSSKKYAILRDLKFDKFITFIKQFTETFYICCLVQGNLTQNETIKMIRECIQSLKCYKLIVTKTPYTLSCLLPLGEKFFKLKNKIHEDVNSIVMNYYQMDVEYSKMSLPIYAEFLEMLIQQPLFYQLRTKEQLGYYVNCCASLGGFTISVCSPVFKFNTKYIDERIESFMKYFIANLKQMTEDEFDIKKNCFNKIRMHKDINLKDEVDRNWYALNLNSTTFDVCRQNILLIKNLKIDQFRQWVIDHFKGGKYFRKLSIQIEGNDHRAIDKIATN